MRVCIFLMQFVHQGKFLHFNAGLEIALLWCQGGFMDNQKNSLSEHNPTEVQLEKWEDEGGAIPNYNSEYGWYDNDSWTTKVKLFFKKMLEKLSSNVTPKNLQTQAAKHHY